MYVSSSLSTILLLASTAAAAGNTWYLKVHTVDAPDTEAFYETGYFVLPSLNNEETDTKIALKPAFTQRIQGWEDALWSLEKSSDKSGSYYYIFEQASKTRSSNARDWKGLAGNTHMNEIHVSSGTRFSGHDWLKFKLSAPDGDSSGNTYVATSQVNMWLCSTFNDADRQDGYTELLTKNIELQDPEKNRCQKAVLYAHRQETYKKNLKDAQALWKDFHDKKASVDETQDRSNLKHDSKAMRGEGFKMEEEHQPHADREEPWETELVDEMKIDN